MNRDSDYFDEFEEPLLDEEFQPHITNDPNIWGLYDVARGRSTEVPQTIYLISGDNASGVMGLLFPNGDFMCKRSSRKGMVVVLQDGGADDGQELKDRILPTNTDIVNISLPTKFEMSVAWDGSTKSPELTVIEDGEVFITNEHSRGLILGDYSRKASETTKLGRLTGASDERPQGAHEFPAWRGNESFGIAA